MAGFTVFRSRAASSSDYPFLLDVQADLLSTLETRLVIPLADRTAVGTAVLRHLNPLIQVEGRPCVALTQQMAAVPRSVLGERVEADIDRSAILTAIDFLVTGI